MWNCKRKNKLVKREIGERNDNISTTSGCVELTLFNFEFRSISGYIKLNYSLPIIL